MDWGEAILERSCDCDDVDEMEILNWVGLYIGIVHVDELYNKTRRD